MEAVIRTTLKLDIMQDSSRGRNANGDLSTILVIDDSVEALEILRQTLSRAGYRVWTAVSGEEALKIVAENGLPQLAIVDVHMPPGMDGFELCERFNQFSDLPVIMLTAVDEADTVVRAIQQYAEDYIVKPFSPSELVARIKRVLERVGKFPYKASCPIQIDTRLSIDFAARKLLKDSDVSSLTPTEARLLYILLRHSGETVETEFLLRRMWPRELTYEDRLHVYVHRLRGKLKVNGAGHQYVVSERGVGYRFQPRSEAVI